MELYSLGEVLDKIEVGQIAISLVNTQYEKNNVGTVIGIKRSTGKLWIINEGKIYRTEAFGFIKADLDESKNKRFQILNLTEEDEKYYESIPIFTYSPEVDEAYWFKKYHDELAEQLLKKYDK